MSSGWDTNDQKSHKSLHIIDLASYAASDTGMKDNRREWLSAIGRRGGAISRRRLDPEQARAMARVHTMSISRSIKRWHLLAGMNRVTSSISSACTTRYCRCLASSGRAPAKIPDSIRTRFWNCCGAVATCDRKTSRDSIWRNASISSQQNAPDSARSTTRQNSSGRARHPMPDACTTRSANRNSWWRPQAIRSAMSCHISAGRVAYCRSRRRRRLTVQPAQSFTSIVDCRRRSTDSCSTSGRE